MTFVSAQEEGTILQTEKVVHAETGILTHRPF